MLLSLSLQSAIKTVRYQPNRLASALLHKCTALRSVPRSHMATEAEKIIKFTYCPLTIGGKEFGRSDSACRTVFALSFIIRFGGPSESDSHSQYTQFTAST